MSSESRVCARSPKPPVCLYEPIIREALEAAMRLTHGRPYVVSSYRSGEPVCDHHIPTRTPCRACDVERLDRGHKLLKRGPLDSTACFDARVSEMRATITGQAEEIVTLRTALRAAEAALQRPAPREFHTTQDPDEYAFRSGVRRDEVL